MNTCASCRHYNKTDDDRCGHPRLSLDPIRGGITLRLCSHMRASDGPCGPEGRLWEGKGVRDPDLPPTPQEAGDPVHSP